MEIQVQENTNQNNYQLQQNQPIASSSNSAQERGDNEINDIEMEDNCSPWIAVTRKIRRYKAVINVKNLQGDNVGQKLRIVNNVVSNMEDFMGTKIHFYGKEQFVMAEFGSKEQMLMACTKVIEENNEFTLTPIVNRGDEEIKNKTIIVKDLPLNVNREILKNILERKAGVQIENIKTRVSEP